MSANKQIADVAVIAIGRNEGQRLLACLTSAIKQAAYVVYVDSGSTDGSVEQAQQLGVKTISLDMSIPFTAARARNEGFRFLRESGHSYKYVHFVDGDCEIHDGWIAKAYDFLESQPDVAVVWGKRRERYPDHSIYNKLCDIEWQQYQPSGEVSTCGGDALMGIEAFQEVNGFRNDLIAGEEPELCIRLRAAGWRIWRLQEDMTLHDVAMTRFSQWWKRTTRSGYAYAQGVALHGAPPVRHFVRQSRSAWIWGLVVPLAIASLALFAGPSALALLLIYPLQIIRLSMQGHHTTRENWLSALFLVLAKFPEMAGQVKFLIERWQGKQSRLIEYK